LFYFYHFVYPSSTFSISLTHSDVLHWSEENLLNKIYNSKSWGNCRCCSILLLLINRFLQVEAH
jgi:hypothetical protein